MMITIPNQTKLEEFAIRIDAHSKAAIENILTSGKLLCEARELLPSNEAFGEWRTIRLPWLKRKMANRWMNAYRNGGENLLGHNVPTTVLYELTAPDVSEETRQEAVDRIKSGETATVKLSKELKAKDKELQRLQSELDKKITPNLDNLIPDLTLLLNKGDITKRIALNYSQLSEEDQSAALSNEESRLLLLNQLDRLEDEKLKLAESATKAHEKADTMQAQFDDAVDKSTQELLAAKNKEIEQVKKEVSQAKMEIREQLEASIRATVDLEYQDELIKTRKEKDKAQRDRQSIQDAYNGVSEEKHKLEYKIKQLEEQAQVDSPANIDAAHAEALKDILDAFKNRLIRFEEDRKIQDYPMVKTWDVINQTISVLCDFRDRTEGIVCINPIGGFQND